jgi:hypothetical protein
MGNALSPMVSNIFMEYFEVITLDTADNKPAQIRRLQQFLQDINSLRPITKFTVELKLIILFRSWTS